MVDLFIQQTNKYRGPIVAIDGLTSTVYQSRNRRLGIFVTRSAGLWQTPVKGRLVRGRKAIISAVRALKSL